MAIGIMPRAEQAWQDVDTLWEADAAMQWERENDCESDHFPGWRRAERSIEKAMKTLCDAEEMLLAASDHVKGSSQEDRLLALVDSVSELSDNVREQFNRMKGM